MGADGNLNSHLAQALSLIPLGMWMPRRFTKPFPSQAPLTPDNTPRDRYYSPILGGGD